MTPCMIAEIVFLVFFKYLFISILESNYNLSYDFTYFQIGNFSINLQIFKLKTITLKVTKLLYIYFFTSNLIKLFKQFCMYYIIITHTNLEVVVR